MTLYEFTALYHPKGKKAKSRVILETTQVVAGDEQEALIAAARKIPEEFAEELDRVELLVRPF